MIPADLIPCPAMPPILREVNSIFAMCIFNYTESKKVFNQDFMICSISIYINLVLDRKSTNNFSLNADLKNLI